MPLQLSPHNALNLAPKSSFKVFGYKQEIVHKMQV